MYLVRQTPKDTDRVVSGLVLTKVLLRNILKNTDGHTSILTDLGEIVVVMHLLKEKQIVIVKRFNFLLSFGICKTS